MKVIEIRRYEDLKGVDPKNPFPAYVGTYWTPVNDNNYGGPAEQWQMITTAWKNHLKIHEVEVPARREPKEQK